MTQSGRGARFSCSVWSPHRLTIASALLLIGTTAFIVIYLNIQNHNGLAAYDQPVLEWMINHRSDSITTIMKLLTNTFSPIGITLMVIFTSGLIFYRTRQRWEPLILVGSLAFTYIISTAIKLITMNPRPPLSAAVPPPAISFSFPSGHVIGIAVVILVAGYLLWSHTKNRRDMAIWISSFIIGVGIIGFSRVYLGYHWLTDVSASVALAIAIFGSILLIEPLERYTATRSSTSSKNR